MSKKDNNINNVDEADVNINDTDVTSDTDKDADTVDCLLYTSPSPRDTR